MQKNILIVTTNYPPATNIGAQRILKICKYLTYKWNIHILTLKEKYYPNSSNENKNSYADKNSRLKVWRTDKIDIYSYLIRLNDQMLKPEEYRSKLPPQTLKSTKFNRRKKWIKYLREKGGILAELLEFPDKDISWLPFLLLKGFFIIKKYDIDIIFTSGPRHSNLVAAMILKKLAPRKKFIADFRDPWARTPWLQELRKSSAVERLKHKIVRYFEKKVVETADHVVFTTQSLKDDFLNHYFYLPANKFEVFYNGYDPDRLHRNIVKKSNLDVSKKNYNKVIFSHIGSLYKKRNPENLVLAINDLIARKLIHREKLHFRFIGNISKDLVYIKDLTYWLRLNDVIEFIPPVSYDVSFKYMESSNVLMILQPAAKLMLPAKFFDYICFDKPILALGEKGSEVDKMVGRRFGIFAEYENMGDIQKGILRLFQNPHQFDKAIVRNRIQFDVTKSIDLFEQRLEALCAITVVR